jgi:hypothetical protein
VAHDAVEKLGPVLDEALEKVPPAIEAARGKVSGDIVPKLTEALAAVAGTTVVVEAKKRGNAAVAAAKGELELPEEKKKSRWFLWLVIFAGVAGVAVVVVRRFLGSRDADWQAARPTTPYAPSRPAGPAAAAGTGAAAATPMVDGMSGEAGDDPQGGMSAHLMNLEADGAAVPDQPAEGGDIDEPSVASSRLDQAPAEAAAVGETPAEPAAEETLLEATAQEAPAESASVGDETATLLGEAPPQVANSKYQGEGVYVGHEPPEGFTIKGNERSMKYHVPESAGYGRTVAEVWFNSEEAAQQAGFVRAQR